MNTKLVKELIALMDTANLKTLEVCEGDVKVRLEKNIVETTHDLRGIPPHIPPIAPVPELKSEVVDFNKLNEVRSPLVGVFYASPSPDSPPFVVTGKKIKKGDVLCIVEAMKQMNEITAEVDGEIADICVKNGDIVEFHQVMFKVH